MPTTEPTALGTVTGLFVTGTGTGCGKTWMTLGLMAALQTRGLRVLGMKPVASGCDPEPEGLRNADALELIAQGACDLPYEIVNPFAFAPPVAPHIAAAEAGVEIALAPIANAYAAMTREADLVLVEGVGGWRVPLGPDLCLDDIPRTLGLSVILVVGLELGCINHALLSVESIQSSGIRLAGWIANQVERDMLVRDANLATLAALIDAPCIGVVPWLDRLDAAAVAEHLQPELVIPSPN